MYDLSSDLHSKDEYLISRDKTLNCEKRKMADGELYKSLS